MNNEWKYILPKGNLARMFLEHQHKELMWIKKTAKEILDKIKLKRRRKHENNT